MVTITARNVWWTYSIDIVRVFLDCGADVNATKVDHWTVLHHASYFGFSMSPKLYLIRGATVNERNNDGRTAFQIAAMRGHKMIMGLLPEYGAHSREEGRSHWIIGLSKTRNLGVKPLRTVDLHGHDAIMKVGSQSIRWVCGGFVLGVRSSFCR